MEEAVNQPARQEDPVVAVCVLKFIECMKERGTDRANYMADPDRQALLKAMCDYTGVEPTGELAKHFLTFIDGVDTGIAIGKASQS